MDQSSTTKIRPFFIKGHVNFTFKHHSFEFLNQNLSADGVGGLPWPPLDPTVDFGQTLEVSLRIPGAPEPLTLQTQAVFTLEKTVRGQYMGLKFRMTDQQKAQIKARISAQGFIPTEYLRKYPRIPSLHLIQTFPLRALVIPPLGSVPPGTIGIVFDVQNLSPNGALLSSESQLALSVEPGMRIDLVLEPRGWFPTPIKAQGLVCRISDERNQPTGNLVRSLGLKLSKIDDTNRAAFIDLLKDILENFKKEPESN